MELVIQSLRTVLDKFIAFLPNLIGAVVVLAVGWIVAIILARVANAILERAGFDSLVQRGRVKETLAEHGSQFDPSHIVGAIVFWAVLITTFLMTANILGLTTVSSLLTRLVAFLPFIAVAVIALVVAVALAQIAYDAIIALIGDRVEGANTIATAAKWGIIAFGIFVALSQLQIAPTIVNGLFLAIVGALALAFAISFGLGNVDLAKKVTGDWYDRASRRRAEAQGKRKEAA